MPAFLPLLHPLLDMPAYKFEATETETGTETKSEMSNESETSRANGSVMMEERRLPEVKGKIWKMSERRWSQFVKIYNFFHSGFISKHLALIWGNSKLFHEIAAASSFKQRALLLVLRHQLSLNFFHLDMRFFSILSSKNLSSLKSNKCRLSSRVASRRVVLFLRIHRLSFIAATAATTTTTTTSSKFRPKIRYQVELTEAVTEQRETYTLYTCYKLLDKRAI